MVLKYSKILTPGILEFCSVNNPDRIAVLPESPQDNLNHFQQWWERNQVPYLNQRIGGWWLYFHYHWQYNNNLYYDLEDGIHEDHNLAVIPDITAEATSLRWIQNRIRLLEVRLEDYQSGNDTASTSEEEDSD